MVSPAKISAANQVLADALRLPREDRSAVIDELMRSLDDEDEDPMAPEERAQLDAAIACSQEQFRAGQGIPMDVVLADLARR
jgi:hypothetical protein